MAANARRVSERAVISESVRGKVEDSLFRFLVTVRKLQLCRDNKEGWQTRDAGIKQAVQRTVKLWRSARRIVFKEYNDRKKELRRAKKSRSF